MKDPDKDVAVIVMDLVNVESISGTMPEVLAVKERGELATFALTGFPQETLRIEPDAVYPVLKQLMPRLVYFNSRRMQTIPITQRKGFLAAEFSYGNMTAFTFIAYLLVSAQIGTGR